MAILKCKCCGGNVIFDPGSTVGECDSCGTKQTLPKAEDEQITNLFNRANNLRLKCEFDKAEAIYEKVVEKDDSEAEAHWGIVLCKYGIEYVEDPKTGQRIPTCHRTLLDAVTADPEYLAAMEYAKEGSQALYKAEALAIDRIQKDILAIVKSEKPFDVFICYKETDENGKRTMDSVIANDIYYQLTQEGFKVFYAAITLEDKLGQEYEPYIFAALNSAKVMLVVGTKPEYFNAVWVKNEWSRFMHLLKADRSKLLIPCYRDMDAYDLPDEFAHLQAQDMSKIGFINDLIRGIKKIITPPNTDSNHDIRRGYVSRDLSYEDRGYRNQRDFSSDPDRDIRRGYAAEDFSNDSYGYPKKRDCSFKEKVNLVSRLNFEYMNLPAIAERKDLIRRKNEAVSEQVSEPKTSKLIWGIIWCCTVYLCIVGIIMIASWAKQKRQYNNMINSKRSQISELDKELNSLNIPTLGEYIRNGFEKENIDISQEELALCLSLAGQLGNRASLGTYNGRHVEWLLIRKETDHVTLMSTYCFGAGNANGYTAPIDFSKLNSYGIRVGVPRIPTTDEFNLCPQAYQAASQFDSNQKVWWRLSTAPRPGKLSDVSPAGVLNAPGHAANDVRISFRPVIDLYF